VDASCSAARVVGSIAARRRRRAFDLKWELVSPDVHGARAQAFWISKLFLCTLSSAVLWSSIPLRARDRPLRSTRAPIVAMERRGFHRRSDSAHSPHDGGHSGSDGGGPVSPRDPQSFSSSTTTTTIGRNPHAAAAFSSHTGSGTSVGNYTVGGGFKFGGGASPGDKDASWFTHDTLSVEGDGRGGCHTLLPNRCRPYLCSMLCTRSELQPPTRNPQAS
jgi:hypothetical protein